MCFRIPHFPRLLCRNIAETCNLPAVVSFVCMEGVFLSNKSGRINYPSSLVPVISHCDNQQWSGEGLEKTASGVTSTSWISAASSFGSPKIQAAVEPSHLKRHGLASVPLICLFSLILLALFPCLAFLHCSIPWHSYLSSILYALHLAESTGFYEHL